MLPLPELPQTYTTLQIPCVACNEAFTIAEAFVTPTGEWRLPPDRHPTVQLRYEENRTRQPIRSPSRSEPEINDGQFDGKKSDTYVNCPRCGADNRNWLKIIGPPPSPTGCALKFFLPSGAIHWQQRFPAAFLSILVACFLAPITLIMALAVQNSVAWAFIIAGVVILAAIFTAVDLTSDWQALRFDNHIRSVLSYKRRSREAYLWWRGFLIIILLSFLIPLVFFQMAPRAFRLLNTILNPTPQTAVQLGQTRLAQLDESYDPFVIEAIEAALQRIEDIQADESLGPEAVEAEIEEILDNLAEYLTAQNLSFTALVRQDIDRQIESLELYVEESKALIDDRRLRQDQAAVNEITADLRLLLLWWLMVGLSCLVSVLMTMRALKSYVAAVDGQMPRPIFSSIADMTRVVAWEAKRSLQIDGDMSHIQWIEVHRNETGGINLIGLHRDEPDVDPVGNMVSQTVRAQKYIISTDIWGRILNTIVRDVRVPRTVFPSYRQTARRPGQAINLPTNHFTLSPLSPPGDDLAQDFFSVPSTPPRLPDRTVVGEAETQRPANGSLAKTVIQPPLHLLIPYPAGPESPAERKDRLCRGLALILNEGFTENEIQQLYVLLHPGYADLTGTHLEKCLDLVNFYSRRRRLAELVQACVDMYPHVLWGDILDLNDE